MDHKGEEEMRFPEEEEMGGGSNKETAGRIVVKLKMDKKKNVEEEIKRSGIHECKMCHKSFVSGKALGGHMSSAHVQANKDYSYTPVAKRAKTAWDSAPGSPTCSVCGKTFPTSKSLYGHMRCHPERDWRGIVPPHNPPPDGCLKGWPSSAKRERGSGRPAKEVQEYSSTTTSPEADEGVKDAVEALLSVQYLVDFECKKNKHVEDSKYEGFSCHQGHASSNGVESSKEVRTSLDNEKVVVGFDLNSMPMEEEDELNDDGL